MTVKENNLLPSAYHNAHKLALLVRAYPNKKISEIDKNNNEIGIAAMLQIPIMEFNIAVWLAEELNLVEVAKDKSKDIRADKDPDKWNFGEGCESLIQNLLYTLKKFAENEVDMEEGYLENWTTGYPVQDIFVASKYVQMAGLARTYELTTLNMVEPSKKQKGRGKKAKKTKSTYTFYTLPENRDKEWGRKMFPDQSKLID